MEGGRGYGGLPTFHFLNTMSIPNISLHHSQAALLKPQRESEKCKTLVLCMLLKMRNFAVARRLKRQGQRKSQQSAWNFQFNSLSYSTPAKSKTTPIFNPDETEIKRNYQYIKPVEHQTLNRVGIIPLSIYKDNPTLYL